MRRLDERGAALFAVLALVAMLAGFVTAGLARSRVAADATAVSADRSRARLLARSGLAIALGDLARLKLRSNKAAAAAGFGPPRRLDVDGAELTAALEDGGNCFNINSLTDRPGEVSGVAPDRFAALLVALGLGDTDASRLARVSADWIDRDGLLRAVPSEWAALPGVTPALWRAARPLLCAQPSREPSALNLNGLTLAQAPLLATLGLSMAAAERALRARPAGGFAAAGDFWAAASPGGEMPRQAAAAAAGVDARWVRAVLVASVGDERVRHVALIDTAASPARVVDGEWTS